MNKKMKLGALLAIVAATPAIVAPQLVSQAQAQDAAAAPAEYPDVPAGHWAYDAINTLSRAGIIEGRPGGNYYGNSPMTRYEFAVAIARLLKNLPPQRPDVPQNPPYNDAALVARIAALEARPQGITREEVNDLINALRREFAGELANLGVRVDAVEGRLTNLENRVAKPNRLTVSPGFLHRFGSATYISPAVGRVLGANSVNPNGFGGIGGQPITGIFRRPQFTSGQFSYTDFELRLTDRVTDRLSVNAALRSLGSTQEDSWSNDTNAGINVREAFAVANLGDRSFLGLRGLNLILGRQHTKFGQGLLYDNELAPTDQFHGQFNIGPVQLNALIGTTNNNQGLAGGGGDPYLNQGAAAFFGNPAGAPGGGGSFVGFPGTFAGTLFNGNGNYANDQESLIRASFNLFRISGNPVNIGIARQSDGVRSQRGDAVDLSIPLFNRTVGVEYVRLRQYADGTRANNNASAYNITVPLLRARVLDLNLAYGKAKDNFEYLLSSSANPYARTYGEALFDRPMALGAPMIGAGVAGAANYMAAKKAVDFNGTLRILRRIPLDFRYYSADGTGGIDLGHVMSVGSTFNVSPGLDLEVKYGEYRPENYQRVKYFRVGANVGF